MNTNTDRSAEDVTDRRRGRILTSPPATSEVVVKVSPATQVAGKSIRITGTGCIGPKEVHIADSEAVKAGVSAPRKNIKYSLESHDPEHGERVKVTTAYVVSPEDSIGRAVVTVICDNGAGNARLYIVNRVDTDGDHIPDDQDAFPDDAFRG
jgi:hypothetical protein